MIQKIKNGIISDLQNGNNNKDINIDKYKNNENNEKNEIDILLDTVENNMNLLLDDTINISRGNKEENIIHYKKKNKKNKKINKKNKKKKKNYKDN